MKAAIIGAAGFLGRVLSRQLHQQGCEVFGYDVAVPDGSPQDLRVQPLDILRDEVAFPPGVRAVYYLAQSPRYREFPQAADHLFGVNVLGAIKAARAAVAAGAEIFCYASSGNVYAPSLRPLAESRPVRRDDPYALSKVAAEEALRLFSAHVPVVAVRLFGLFGPGQQTMLPVTLLRKIKAGEPIVLEGVEGEGSEPEGLTISFSFVEDVARCLQQIAETATSPLPAVLNVAAAEPVSIRRFAATLGDILGITPTFERAKTPRKFNLIADVGLLQALLRPVFLPFPEAMQLTYGA